MDENSPLSGAFAGHDAFERREDDRFVATTTPFEATVDATDDGRVEVTVRVPTLSAAVEGSVGDAVANGWYETLELRLEDAFDVARGADGEVAVERDPSAREVVVTLSFAVGDPYRSADDAVALVDFVEGTYVQGVIPGYDYRDPVAGLLATARRNAQAGDPDRR